MRTLVGAVVVLDLVEDAGVASTLRTGAVGLGLVRRSLSYRKGLVFCLDLVRCLFGTVGASVVAGSCLVVDMGDRHVT